MLIRVFVQNASNKFEVHKMTRMSTLHLRCYCRIAARLNVILRDFPSVMYFQTDVQKMLTLNLFKARLDRFWANQDVKYDFTADLTGIGDRCDLILYSICVLTPVSITRPWRVTLDRVFVCSCLLFFYDCLQS